MRPANQLDFDKTISYCDLLVCTMPSQIMDQSAVSASSHYFEEIHCTAEPTLLTLSGQKHVGFWKPSYATDYLGNGGLMPLNGSKLAGPTSLENLSSIDVADYLGFSPVREQMNKPRSEKEGFSNFPGNPWISMDSQPNTWSSLYFQSTMHALNGETDTRSIGCESSLSSSTLYELFRTKGRLSRNGALLLEPAIAVTSEDEEVEPSESQEEIEARTIGNLLPDEDDLFYGVSGKGRNNSRASSGDELEDFELFSSGGGMELEGDYQKNGVIAPSCMENGTNKMLHNLARSPVNSCIEPNWSLGFPVDLASSAKMMPFDRSICSQEPHQFPNGLKLFGTQAIPELHSHPFPNHEGFANGSPYTASRTFMEMSGNVVKPTGRRLNTGLTSAAASNGHPVGLSPRGFGSLGNGQVIHGNHHIWNNNSQQQHSPNSVIWPHSPSGINGFHAHHFPPVTAISRAPPMLVKVGSPVHHHIASAPAINRTLWDRRHAYLATEPSEASGFNQVPPSHPLEISNHSAFAHVAGNRMDMPSINVGPRSPHLFSRRNSMISVPASFDSPNERGRSFSYRRSDLSSNSADKKQFELDIDRILCGEDSRTTLMIKNIPNKYTSKMLLAAIDDHCKGTYDFIYLPIDFKNKCNVGYAFINMTDPQKIIPFHKSFNGKKWEKFNSEKVASLAYARIQGKAALIAHFQNSSLMNEDKRCRPILFHTDGPNAGDQEPFPMGTNIRSRPGKPRTHNIEESCSHGCSSVCSSTNKPDYPNQANSPSNHSTLSKSVLAAN